MISTATTLDTQNISRLLAKLVQSGNFETSVSHLYEHFPETERKFIVEHVLFDMYLMLPAPLAAKVRTHQDLLTGHTARTRQHWEMPSGRTYPVFGGIMRIVGAITAIWAVIGVLTFGVIHYRYSRHVSHPNSDLRMIHDADQLGHELVRRLEVTR
ncbi:hypothetical protein [Edaphobacter modestus]|uniref:Uncharacterized protein n=1 Tax=Edaphobacter modestus TaxID=388466 RepID=A0A4Q7XXU8_9BACT|nr:hypothetical protein [Edaphobacter modestus]RZU28908.1 hypothetical protein BDD14_6491 [Edaphobacter modestus]